MRLMIFLSALKRGWVLQMVDASKHSLYFLVVVAGD